VRDSNIDDLVKAAGINTLLWGGIHNPIIPVSANEKTAERLMNLFSVDVLYAVEQIKEIDQLLNKHQFLRAEYPADRSIIYEDWRTKKNIIWYLDSLDIIDFYWQTELKHKTKEYRSNCLLVEWEDSDDLKNLFSILFGYFPSSFNLREDFRDAFLKGLRSRDVKIAPGGVLDGKLEKGIYPLRLTDMHLVSWGRPFWQDGIYIGEETDFYDMVNFWNLRAAGLAVQFLPKNHIERFAEFINSHIVKLDKTPNRNLNIEDCITVYHRLENQEELSEIVKKFHPTKKLLTSRCSETIWEGRSKKVAGFYLEHDRTLANVEKSYNHYTVTTSLPEKRFIVNVRDDAGLKKLVVSINPISEYDYPEHTLRPPYIRELNEFYSRQIAFDPWRLRTEPDGIAIIINVYDNSLLLHPLSDQVLIQRILKLAGIDTEISQAGLIASRIIKKLNGLHGGTGFRIGGVRKLIGKLKAEDCITRGEATKIIWDDGMFQKYEHTGLLGIGAQKLTTQDIFDSLLARDIFRAGLELACEHCKLASWLSLRDLDDVWVCSYCGEENKTNQHLRNRGDWRFRKSGFFAKDDRQQGAIPVILTLLVFSRISSLSEFTFCPSLKLTVDSKEYEIDFCILKYRQGGQIEIGIGECKSEGGKINQNDISNLKLIREKIQATDIDCYLVLSKTAEHFDSEEILLFKALLDMNIPFILLTNRELEPHHPYDEIQDEKLPHKHPFTLGQMAEDSEYILCKE